MKNILIVGAGNIGFWYLIAAISTKLKVNIFIYDKSLNQIEKFKKDINLIKKISIFVLIWLNPQKIDLAIISTTSSGK